MGIGQKVKFVMSRRTVVEARDVSKKYHIGGLRPARVTAKEMAASALLQPFRRIRAVLRGAPPTDVEREFWALKDVSFDIYEGETLGIIGVNGSGKSTLLRIISNITHPTTGYVLTRGRVGTLLEVGSGFNYELSGRENMYVNAVTLGMSQREVDRNLESILDFAEIHDFIDTPLKRYSTGMVMRLAFSVAIHLKPEILIIDEVIAVGDMAFIEKSFERVKEIARSGTTVIVVSHMMHFVQELCNRVLWLDKGRIVETGDVEAVSQRYLAKILTPKVPPQLADAPGAQGDDEALLGVLPPGLSLRTVAKLRAAVHGAYISQMSIIVDTDRRVLALSESLASVDDSEIELGVGQPLALLGDARIDDAAVIALAEQRAVITPAFALKQELHVVVRPLYESSPFSGSDPIAAVAVLYPVRSVAEFPADSAKRQQIRRVELIPLDESAVDAGLLLRVTYDVNVPDPVEILSIDIYDSANQRAYYTNDDFLDMPDKRAPGSHHAELVIPTALMGAGSYRVQCAFWSPEHSHVEDLPGEHLLFVIPERENRLTRNGIPWLSVLYRPDQWRMPGASLPAIEPHSSWKDKS